MIKENLNSAYPNHYCLIVNFVDNVFVADYTEQTKTSLPRRSVEFFSPTPPNDIDCFSIINTVNLSLEGIIFDNSSFTDGHGNSRSQCESVLFPSTSGSDTWILFCELKYSSKPINNSNNLKKAIKQLYRTRFYYCQNNILSYTNTCYLIASLPLQSEPFTNFSISPAFLSKLKRKRNIILRMKNSVEILNSNLLAI